jgi:CheY-like chemotaxis protein
MVVEGDGAVDNIKTLEWWPPRTRPRKSEMSTSAYQETYDDACQPAQLKLAKRKLAKKGSKILVIDDDHLMCLGLEVRLKANCYDACFAHDAEFAISKALSERPDLIILDIGLPRADGYFVMRRLQAFPQLADVPIIVLTGNGGFTQERRCRDAGAKRFFEKPADIGDLLTAIGQLT